MIKVNAKETKISIGKFAGSYRYVLSPMLYTTLPASKVINEAAIRSGLNKGTITAAYQAIGDTLAAWATEGHGVTIPGLGIMRFGLRADSVATAEEVASSLITSRRVLFTLPTTRTTQATTRAIPTLALVTTILAKPIPEATRQNNPTL